MGLLFSERHLKFPSAQLHSFSEVNVLPRKTGPLGMTNVHQPLPSFPCSFTGSGWCLHERPYENWGQLRQNTATAHVSLCFFWEGKGFYIILLRDWKQGNCRVWEVWSAQYPRPNLNPGHFRILFKITPNTLFVCMEHSYSKNLQHMGRRRDGLHDINLYERSKKTFWSHTLFIKNIFRGQEKNKHYKHSI